MNVPIIEIKTENGRILMNVDNKEINEELILSLSDPL